MSEIIKTKIISWHPDDSLVKYFKIDKTRELDMRKYYWKTFRQDVESYIKRYDVCLASKAMTRKPDGDLQLLPLLTHWWKELLIDLVTRLLISSNWKRDSYNSILVIVNWLTKMVHYKPVKIAINTAGLAKIVLDLVIRHHSILNSIMTNRGSLFISKFWSSLCFFLDI